jgi:hypothetical protein
MRVYIPFDDGSAVSYDGKEFTIHKQPVGIDANLRALAEGTAERVWRERRKDLVKALEDAWWREQARRRQTGMKKIYSKRIVRSAEVESS